MFIFFTLSVPSLVTTASHPNHHMNCLLSFYFNLLSLCALSLDGGPPRLHIGYVSGDFGNHPVCEDMLSVYEFHNRSQVVVSAYSLSNAGLGHAWRKTVEEHADKYVNFFLKKI
jgi:hypothetical protein